MTQAQAMTKADNKQLQTAQIRLAAALTRQAAAIGTMRAAQQAYSANRDTAIDDSLLDKFWDSSNALGREEAAVAAAKRALVVAVGDYDQAQAIIYDIEAALQ